MSEDLYPSDEDLARIKDWSLDDVENLWAFIGSKWMWPDWGLSIEGGMWRMATGGWSGNEDIIDALRKNLMFWVMCWQRSERGGLHWFKPWKEGNDRLVP